MEEPNKEMDFRSSQRIELVPWSTPVQRLGRLQKEEIAEGREDR